MKLKNILYDADILNRSIKRIAHEILENTENPEKLCLVGIKTRGVPFAKRLREAIMKIENIDVPVGTLDITLYRDDLKIISQDEPVISSTEIDFDIEAVAEIFIKDVEKVYPDLIRNYYKLDDVEVNIDNIALKRNWIISGGRPDTKRAAQNLLNDFRVGRLGKLTLDIHE